MKKRLSRIFSSTSAAVLSLSTLLTLGFSGVAHAATFTCTWAGGGGDSNFSTAGNWTGCNGAAPDPLNDTDDLVFPTDTATDFAPVNDLTGATFNSVAFSGTGGSSFNITGNSFTLAGDVTDTSDKANTIATDIVLTSTTTFTVPSGFTMTLSGTVRGAGSVVLAGAGNLTMGTVTITGALTANAGTLTVDYGTGLSVSALTVADGATIWFANPSFSGTSTIAYPVTVGGAGASSGAL
ncbi:hypothetical protein KDA14_00585, partial [Candidatus Saccharibacteria bacterium]|nr:hypothetical protein [Candidatus Saccharibacteria bacterium]